MPEPYAHQIPSELVKNVTALCGARGRDWLRNLPALIRELEQTWGIKAGTPFEKGEYNFVAAARSENGKEAVLKIAPPYVQTEIHAEAEFLRSCNGNDCVRLLSEDRERFALLIERARPGVTLDVHFAADPFACVEPAITVLKSILMPPPPNPSDVQSLDDWFDRFGRFRETGFLQTYGERTMAIYQRMKKQSGRIHYLHGDFHPGNVVTSGKAFAAIDPKGLVGHIAYDIAVFLNNLHWWQKGKPNVEAELQKALIKFGAAFDIADAELREAAYASMVIGAWWNFDEMPEHYDNQVALADVWDI